MSPDGPRWDVRRRTATQPIEDRSLEKRLIVAPPEGHGNRRHSRQKRRIPGGAAACSLPTPDPPSLSVPERLEILH